MFINLRDDYHIKEEINDGLIIGKNKGLYINEILCIFVCVLL